MSICLYKNQEYDLASSKARKKLGQVDEFSSKIADLAENWVGNHENFTFLTSGTTGTIKQVVHPRSKVILSAKMTIDYFNLNSLDTALLVLDPSRVAGAMMIIRAFIANMKIIALEPPSDFNNYLPYVKDCTFTAVVPIQMQKILQSPNVLSAFSAYKAILVGGSSVNYSTRKEIIDAKLPAFETFGMTETVTHFAIRDLRESSDDNPFTVIGNHIIQQNSNGCLILKGELTDDNPLSTHDLIHLRDSTTFTWVGRSDFIINSGGIKLSPEELEEKIAETVYAFGISNRFLISSVPDEKLGQKVVLVLEGTYISDQITRELLNSLKRRLNKYESPKEVIFIDKFPEAANSKVDRKEVISILT